MADRFSKQLLHEIRNRIPIQDLIKDKLKIHSRVEGSKYLYKSFVTFSDATTMECGNRA
ncbi:hypothetical protein QUF76_16930 [Desulfobacterales bacterium HSG16]|nr:hypothetical protein [Desulfobacterales bacterium HSG16]